MCQNHTEGGCTDWMVLFYHPSWEWLLAQGAKVDGFIEKDSFCDHPEPTAAGVGGPFPVKKVSPGYLRFRLRFISSPSTNALSS